MKESNNKPVKWHSNISQLEKNFYFHSLIKYTNNTQHYIVEDIQNYMQQFGIENQVLYYLKQVFLTDQKEFDYQVRYYNDLFHYCSNLSIRRKDVCRLLKYFVHKDQQNSQYEIVLIMEYGEADRIDVDQIENSHINKFLKNIIGLLQDMKKYSEVNHGNLDIQNIILVQDILKISGFKPIFINKKNSGWKEQIANEYSRERLDLFLLGLLWLQFKKFSIRELTKEMNSKQLVFNNIKNTFLDHMESLNGIEGKEILVKLLDLQNYPQFDLQQLQLVFDTNLLLKDIQTKDDENLNPFKESLKSEYVNSSLQDEHAIKRPMIINKDFSLKADIVANFKKHNKDELISIQDLNDDSQPVEIYNEEKQQKIKEKNERLSVSNKENPKKYSSQYNSEKNFESYKEQIQKIKEEAQQKNQMQNVIQEQPQIVNEQSKEQLQDNKQNNLEESYRESLVNFSLDQQSVQKDKDMMSKNNSSGVFLLNSMDSRQIGMHEKKQQKSDSKKNHDDVQKRDSKNRLLSYLDSGKKGSIKKNEKQTKIENDTIEEKDESKFESVKPQVVEEDHLNINHKFDKQTVLVKGSNEENNDKEQNGQNQIEQKVTEEKQNQDQGQRFYELVQKAQQKEKEKKQSNRELNEQKEDQNQDMNLNQKEIQQDLNNENQVEEKTKEKPQKKQSNKQGKKNTYKDMFMKNKNQKKSENKKKETKNYTNNLSKASNNRNSYKNLYSYQKTQNKEQKKEELDTKIQKVLKKHQAKMSKNKRILTKDEKLDKSLEQVRRQKYGTYNPSQKNKSKDQKPNQKIKSLLKQSKISNINENEEFQTQTKVFEDINKKLFQSIPQKKQQQNTDMPITKKKEIQNDYKSIRPMKQKKIQSLQADQNPLVSGLPDIKQKDKLDKSSFDIKFDISLNKSRNYDSYIDCKYKSNNYRSRSKNLPTDNILQDVYQHQNTMGNETLNFSVDNSFVNNYQDHNKTIENIMEKFENKKVDTSQMSQSQKPKKKAQFNLGEVQKLLNSAMNKQQPGQQQKPQDSSLNQSLNRSMNKSLNKSMNKSMNRSMNRSVNKSKNYSYVKNEQTLQQKLKNDPEILELQFGKDYQQKMKTLAILLKHKKLEEAIELLFYVLQTEIGQAKIDAYKQIGILYCYTNDLDKAVEYTIRGIEYQDNQNLNENYVENKKALLMNLAITYSKRKEYDNCLDILMDDLFQNESNQPIAYMTILGDCHYSMKSFLNAFECYKEQIERLCQLLLNKDVYHNFILVTKKAIASLIEGQEFQFFPDFVKFVIKCGKRFSIAQETYEGQAKFTKLQDKLICAMIHVIWGKRDIQFMQHLMKYQREKKLINLKNLSSKEVNILVDDILSYALDLKKSDQFKKFRNDFYLANDYILQAINSVKNQKPLQRQKVITLFNQGIFLIQEKNFQLAKTHHQECLDILQDKDIKNEQQIYVILYNIGLSMYKMNDEENCIYYLEQIYQRNCNNKQILSQALYLLVLSYYKTSQYEKIIQYFDSPLNKQHEVTSDLEFEHLQIVLFLYFFANFRVRSGSLKEKLLNYQEQLKHDQDELLYHIVLANSKLMLKYFREKNLKVNIPMQEKLSNLLLKKQKNQNELMKMAKDFYFQQVEQVQLGQCIAQYGIKAQANFLTSFILQMINLLNFSCSREYSLEERRKVLKYLTSLTKNEEFTNKLFSQSLSYGQNKESKHDLTFINQEISKLDTTQNLGASQRINKVEKVKETQKEQPKKVAKKQQKNSQKVQSSEKLFEKLKTDQDFEKLWLCASKEKLDSIKDLILENCLRNYNHVDKQRALLKLIFTNKLKQNEKQIVAGIKNLKFHKMEFKDFLEIVQALLLSQDNNNLKAFLTRVYREKREYFQEIIDAINEKFLENFDQILTNIKIQNFNEKQFYIENSVFYHLLSEDFKPNKPFLILTEELSILIVNFFKCIKLKSFNFVKEVIDPSIIEKYKVFNLIYQYFVKDKRQEQAKNINKALKIACNIESQNFETNMYVLYLLINYCHSENLVEVQIIEQLRQLFQSEDMNQQQLYMFVLITSLISNIYFRKQQWMKSNKLKQLTFEGFKKLDIQNLENLKVKDYPVYSKEYLLFQIFSFWYMNEHNLGSRDLAKRCLASMEKLDFQDENLKNQFLMLKQYDKKFTEAGLENYQMLDLENDGIVNEILNNVQMLLVE